MQNDFAGEQKYRKESDRVRRMHFFNERMKAISYLCIVIPYHRYHPSIGIAYEYDRKDVLFAVSLVTEFCAV